MDKSGQAIAECWREFWGINSKLLDLLTIPRLTAERIKNLSALSGVAYEKLGAIFPSLVAPTPVPTPAADEKTIPRQERKEVSHQRNDPCSQTKSAEGRILCVSQQRLAALGATLSAGPGSTLASCYFTVRSRDMPRILWPWTGQYTL